MSTNQKSDHNWFQPMLFTLINSIQQPQLTLYAEWGDLTKSFKIPRVRDRAFAEMFPLMGESQTKGHSYKIAQRIVNLRNLLLHEIVEARSRGGHLKR